MRAMDATAERWDLLAEHVVLRRLELGYDSQKRFAENSGIGIATLSRIERAVYRPGNSLEVIVKLQQALAWDVGSVKAILDGGRPVPLDRSA